MRLPTIEEHAEACVSEFQFGVEFVWWRSPELTAKSNPSAVHRETSARFVRRTDATRGGAHSSDAPYQRNANARGFVERAVRSLRAAACTPLNSAAKLSDIVR
jgi:hypothetical protein